MQNLRRNICDEDLLELGRGQIYKKGHQCNNFFREREWAAASELKNIH